MDIEAVPFSLDTIVHSLCKIMILQAERKGLILNHHSSYNEDEELIGDPGRIRQILTNLLSNSIKFTRKGSVTLSISLVSSTEPPEAEHIQENHLDPNASLSHAEEHKAEEGTILEFCVKDTGQGISEEVIPKLFQPFSQADSSTARLHGGTGLGLNISQQLVKLMGGQIKLVSQVNVGTTVTFSVPFKTVKKQKEEGCPTVVHYAIPTSDQSGTQNQACTFVNGSPAIMENKDLSAFNMQILHVKHKESVTEESPNGNTKAKLHILVVEDK